MILPDTELISILQSEQQMKDYLQAHDRDLQTIDTRIWKIHFRAPKKQRMAVLNLFFDKLVAKKRIALNCLPKEMLLASVYKTLNIPYKWNPVTNITPNVGKQNNGSRSVDKYQKYYNISPKQSVEMNLNGDVYTFDETVLRPIIKYSDFKKRKQQKENLSQSRSEFHINMFEPVASSTPKSLVSKQINVEKAYGKKTKSVQVLKSSTGNRALIELENSRFDALLKSSTKKSIRPKPSQATKVNINTNKEPERATNNRVDSSPIIRKSFSETVNVGQISLDVGSLSPDRIPSDEHSTTVAMPLEARLTLSPVGKSSEKCSPSAIHEKQKSNKKNEENQVVTFTVQADVHAEDVSSLNSVDTMQVEITTNRLIEENCNFISEEDTLARVTDERFENVLNKQKLGTIHPNQQVDDLISLFEEDSEISLGSSQGIINTRCSSIKSLRPSLDILFIAKKQKHENDKINVDNMWPATFPQNQEDEISVHQVLLAGPSNHDTPEAAREVPTVSRDASGDVEIYERLREDFETIQKVIPHVASPGKTCAKQEHAVPISDYSEIDCAADDTRFEQTVPELDIGANDEISSFVPEHIPKSSPSQICESPLVESEDIVFKNTRTLSSRCRKNVECSTSSSVISSQSPMSSNVQDEGVFRMCMETPHAKDSKKRKSNTQKTKTITDFVDYKITKKATSTKSTKDKIESLRKVDEGLTTPVAVIKEQSSTKRTFRKLYSEYSDDFFDKLKHRGSKVKRKSISSSSEPEPPTSQQSTGKSYPKPASESLEFIADKFSLLKLDVRKKSCAAVDTSSDCSQNLSIGKFDMTKKHCQVAPSPSLFSNKSSTDTSQPKTDLSNSNSSKSLPTTKQPDSQMNSLSKTSSHSSRVRSANKCLIIKSPTIEAHVESCSTTNKMRHVEEDLKRAREISLFSPSSICTSDKESDTSPLSGIQRSKVTKTRKERNDNIYFNYKFPDQSDSSSECDIRTYDTPTTLYIPKSMTEKSSQVICKQISSPEDNVGRFPKICEETQSSKTEKKNNRSVNKRFGFFSEDEYETDELAIILDKSFIETQYSKQKIRSQNAVMAKGEDVSVDYTEDIRALLNEVNSLNNRRSDQNDETTNVVPNLETQNSIDIDYHEMMWNSFPDSSETAQSTADQKLQEARNMLKRVYENTDSLNLAQFISSTQSSLKCSSNQTNFDLSDDDFL